MITIKEVTTKKDMKAFVEFSMELYKDNECYVPDLAQDLYDTFNPEKNAAYEFCEAKLFLALNEQGAVVGRVAGIINTKANTTWNNRNVRFGWIDFIDDIEVVRALIGAVEQFGRERGMTEIEGPLGFTDFDKEGMLVEGYDKLGTIATIYNHPYYPKLIEQLGFEKSIDWIEYRIQVPQAVPERITRVANIVQKKFDLRFAPHGGMSVKTFLDKYGSSFFDCINEAYTPLYGYSALSEKQKKNYLDTYSMVLDLKLLTLIIDKDDRVVACGITIPNMSEAFRKTKGKLLPLGWYHLLKGLKWGRSKTCDLMLAAVLPEYQGKGVNAMFINDLIPAIRDAGFTEVESNPELETNTKIQSQWDMFERKQHKRRRCFKKSIG